MLGQVDLSPTMPIAEGVLLCISQEAELLVGQPNSSISGVRDTLEIFTIASRSAMAMATGSTAITSATDFPSTTGCVDLLTGWLVSNIKGSSVCLDGIEAIMVGPGDRCRRDTCSL